MESLMLPCVLTLCLPVALAAAPQECTLETQRLELPGEAPGDGFGFRVERAGDVALVPSPFRGDLDLGAVSVWERTPGGVWKLAKELQPSGGSAFGSGLAIDGMRVLVGAPSRGPGTREAGAVYVFERDRGGAGAWGEVTHFTPPSAGAGAGFGHALALRGDRLLVGAPHFLLGVPGTAYLYRRDAGAPEGWALERELQSSDPASGFQFGLDVALGEHLLAVTGSLNAFLPFQDAVHVFAEDAGGTGAWGEVRRIDSPPGAYDRFAIDLDLEGDRLIAVAPTVGIPEANASGALYLFRRDLGGPEGWGLERRIEKRTTASGAFSPEQATLRGDWIVTGNGRQVTIFGRDVGGHEAWGEVTSLRDEGSDADVRFGSALALEGDQLLVGASGHFSSTQSGSVHVYDLARLARVTWRNDGAGSNPDVHAYRDRPILGRTIQAEVDLRGTAHDRALLLVFARPVEAVLPRGQVLLGGRLLASRSAPRVSGRARFLIDVPPDVALCGRTMTTQAALLGAGRFELSNAQDLVLGAP